MKRKYSILFTLFGYVCFERIIIIKFVFWEYNFLKRDDMSIIFLQQILNDRLLLIVIIGAKK